MKKIIFFLCISLSLTISSCDHLFPIRIRMGKRTRPDMPIRINLNEAKCNFQCAQEGFLSGFDPMYPRELPFYYAGSTTRNKHDVLLLCGTKIRLLKLRCSIHKPFFKFRYAHVFHALFETGSGVKFEYTVWGWSCKKLENHDELLNLFLLYASRAFKML